MGKNNKSVKSVLWNEADDDDFTPPPAHHFLHATVNSLKHMLSIVMETYGEDSREADAALEGVW